MASIDRTAYPQFKRNPVVRELVALYSVNEPELAFIVKHARQPASRLTLAILLKSFQRLRYFPALDEVPAAVVRHIRGALKFRIQVKPTQPSAVTRYRYHALVRQHVDFRAFEDGGLDVAARAMRDAAAVMGSSRWRCARRSTRSGRWTSCTTSSATVAASACSTCSTTSIAKDWPSRSTCRCPRLA